MIHMLCDGVFGGLSFLLAFYVTRLVADREKQPTRYLIILILIGVGGTRLAGEILTPKILAWRAQGQVAEYLDKDPMFRRIVADYPEMRAPLEEALQAGMQRGNRAAGVAAARELIEKVFPAYLARAVNEDLREFASATVDTLKALQTKDPERCFRFLHPGVAGGIELAEDEGRQQQYDLISRIVAEAPKAPVDPQDASDVLDGVAAALSQRYGEQVQMLAAPEEPGVDRAQVCAMTIDMYEQILALPADDADRLLRSLFAL